MKNKKSMTNKNKGGSDGYVAAGILIVVVIIIGVIFRDQISTYITNFFTSLTNLSNNSFF